MSSQHTHLSGSTASCRISRFFLDFNVRILTSLLTQIPERMSQQSTSRCPLLRTVRRSATDSPEDSAAARTRQVIGTQPGYLHPSRPTPLEIIRTDSKTQFTPRIHQHLNARVLRPQFHPFQHRAPSTVKRSQNTFPPTHGSHPSRATASSLLTESMFPSRPPSLVASQ